MRTKTEEEKVLSEELSKCMLSHYKYCAAGMLLGLPLSIHRKSYWPVTLAAVAGTAADFMEGNTNCKQQREALLACIDRNEAAEAANRQRGASGGEGAASPLDAGAPLEEWPQQAPAQPDWSEEARWEDKNGDRDDRSRGGEDDDKW